MKRTSTTSVLVAALALMGALAAGLISSATAGTLAHASKHKAKPKAISCKALIPGSLLIHDVAVDTGTAPEVGPVAEVNPHHDKRGPLRGITLRLCSMSFTNDGIGNAGAYGNLSYVPAPSFFWYAGTAVTTREFNRFYNIETFSSSLGPESGGPFTKHRIRSLGSRAFLRTDSQAETDNNPKYQSDYGLYVLSKGKHGKPGNLLILYAWPLSLDREKQIVAGVLRHKGF